MGRKKDRFWEYAEELNDKFKCNFCQRQFTGGISRIKAHLAKVTGRNINACTNVPEDVQREAYIAIGGPNKKVKEAPSTSNFEKNKTTSTSSSSPSTILHHSTALEPCNNKDTSAVDKLLAQHVVLNNIPFDVVQTTPFSLFVQGVAEYGPGYSLPSDSTLKTKLIPDLRMEVDDYIGNVKKSWVTTGCTLMLDLWGDKKQGHFISIIAYCPKGAVFMKLVEIPNDRKEESNLANSVSSVIEEIGPDHVVQLITNARKFESVGDELVLKYPQMYKTRCAAHGIYLLLKDIYEEVGWVKKVIDDANLIVTYMHRSTIISSLMREHTNKELKRPCMTRFASNFLMLQSIFDVKKELLSLVASSKWRELGCNKEDMAKRVTSIIGRTQFWSQGQEVLLVLKPIVRVLQLVESDGSTSGYIYEAMERAKEAIKQLCSNNQTKYMQIWKLFEESHTQHIIHPIHAAAAFLNPAYLCSDNFREDSKMKEGISFILENLVAIEEEDKFIKEVQIYRIKESSLFTNIAKKMLKTSHPRTWWDFNGDTLPTLKKYAVRILSQPCSISSWERNWSAFEVAQTKKRNKLAPELLDNLVYVRMNTMMMEKFKMLEAQGTELIDLDKLGELIKYVDHEQDYVGDALDAIDEGLDDDVIIKDANPAQPDEAQGTKPNDLDKLSELPEYADHELDCEGDALDAIKEVDDNVIMNDADSSRPNENSFHQMENVGEFFVSAFLQQLFNKLNSLELREFAHQEQIDTKLKKWEGFLSKIEPVLDDAEGKQMANSMVKNWLSELTDLAYDMEDIVDEIGNEALQHQLMVVPQASSSNVQTLTPASSTGLNSSAIISPSELTNLAYVEDNILEEIRHEDIGFEPLRLQLTDEAHTSTSNVPTLIPASSSGFNPSAINFNVKMVTKIDEITSRLQDIVTQKYVLSLREKAGRRINEFSGRPLTTSLLDKSPLYGREKDKNAILELLLGDESSDKVVIVGVGGVGKTTLARLVYNDVKVNRCFDLKAWIYVSKNSNILRIIKTIFQAVTQETDEYEDLDDLNSLDSLQEDLIKELSGKKFLLVLDDVWKESCDQWYALHRCFMAGAVGSKMVVTTCDESIVSTMGTISPYCLKELSFEDCLSLFTHHAIGKEVFDGLSNLEVIGEEIVRRCNGLPLAVKIIGGLLCSKLNCEEWKDILNSDIWDLSAERSGIVPVLRLSYHHLPSYLKRCFAYCAIFPKGYEFDKDQLISLWMAEGLLQDPKGKKRMEDLGLEYFLELLSRSFIQESSSNKSRFVVHDLINDLAKSVAGEICFNLENYTSDKSLEKIRHSSVNPCPYDSAKRFEVFYGMKRLRTFLSSPVPVSGYGCGFLSNKVLNDLLPELRYLRSLSLAGFKIRELPDSIGDLKQLRYLNLSYNDIQRLPESLSALLNLQTLILYGCKTLTKLPAGIGNLTNMHHLDIIDTDNLDVMPLGIGNLTSLQTLPKFIVGKGDGLRVRDLKNLSHLQGQLSISKLCNVVDIRDAWDANLKEKPGLDDLVLKWSDAEKQGCDDLLLRWSNNFHDSQNERDKMLVLGWLQPHQNLKKLTIASYDGTKFPHWIGDPSFSNLVQLNLCYCTESTSLPSLGRLPLLKDLRIEGMNAVRTVGLEFYGVGGSNFVKAFPSLESLSFKDMLGWELWFSCTGNEVEDVFPCLRKLEIQNCPNLNGELSLPLLAGLDDLHIPRHPSLANSFVSLPSLHELKISKCNVGILMSLVNLTSLTILKIDKISRLAFLDIIGQLVALEVVEIENCSELINLWNDEANLGNLACLKKLVVMSCPKLVSLAGEEGGLLPCNLEELVLVGCDNLKKLPNGLHSLTCLRSLCIKSCSRLVSLAGEEGGLLPCNLEELVLVDCDELEKLPNGLHSLTCLRSLSICICPKLVSFPATGLPNTLRRLKLYDCMALESVPDGMTIHGGNSNQCLLEELVIDDCPSLKSFPRGMLPTTVKKLEISKCWNLESLPEGMMFDDNDNNNTFHLKSLKISNCTQLKSLSKRIFHNNTSLEVIRLSDCRNLRSLPLECLHRLVHLSELYISGCPALESFPERGLSIPNLKILKIRDCENLKSLPNQMHNLTSLQTLNIVRCPEIMSFPEGGLPPNLTSLAINYCENLPQSMSEWSLHRLSSLREFTIQFGPWSNCPLDMVSFPDDDCCLLPTTLTYIRLEGISNLESISKGIQNLTSLEKLEISFCDKLQSLPKEGLPASLGYLCIWECPILGERCLKEEGEYWPIISHIPCVEIESEIQ